MISGRAYFGQCIKTAMCPAVLQRAAARSILRRLQEQPEACDRAVDMLRLSQSQATRLFALQAWRGPACVPRGASWADTCRMRAACMHACMHARSRLALCSCAS
jgi:hypothetical protein